jgi:hypothetical protein
MRVSVWVWVLMLAGGMVAVPVAGFAQTDEIQVYDGGLAPVGTFNLTLHNNFVAKGLTTPAFPGAVVADKSWNGVPEWALGVTPWFEAGLYLPLYSHDETSGFGLDGFKLRALFAVPHADDRRFFYGANFEFSINAHRWDTTRFTSEIRPIIGWHLAPVDIIVNPIVDTAYDGFGNPSSCPAARIAYNFRSGWALLWQKNTRTLAGSTTSRRRTSRCSTVVRGGGSQLEGLEIEAGVGVGLTDVTDRLRRSS